MRLGAVVVVVWIAGCAERPVELERQADVDAICSEGQVAFSYPLDTPDGGRTSEKLIPKAVSAGCEAPLGAWTDGTDVEAGGVRKIAYELREARKTLLCCPP